MLSLIALSRGHALPLPAGRFWRPRTSRRKGARSPRNDCPSGRGNGQSATTNRPWHSRGRALSASANLPCPRTGHSRVRDHRQAVAQPRPRTLRVRELTVSGHRPQSCPRPRTRRGTAAAPHSPRPRACRVRAQARVVSGTAGSPCPHRGKAATGPWTGNRRGRVVAVDSPHVRSVHDQAVATDYPCPRTCLGSGQSVSGNSDCPPPTEV